MEVVKLNRSKSFITFLPKSDNFRSDSFRMSTVCYSDLGQPLYLEFGIEEGKLYILPSDKGCKVYTQSRTVIVTDLNKFLVNNRYYLESKRYELLQDTKGFYIQIKEEK